MDENTLNYLRKLAREQVCKGVLYEPRLMFDRLIFEADGPNELFADSNVFVNGEQYPMRITHILAVMDPGETLSPDPAPVQGDPRLIQRFGLRVMSNDTYYRHGDFIPLPLLHNVATAASPVTSPGVSTWKLPFPVMLAQRDSFDVPVQLEAAPAANVTRRVGCALNGLGSLSRRPVQLSADRALANADETDLDIGDLRSDGAEPVELYELNWWCGPESSDNDGAGDIRQMASGIRQTGNGTHESWHVAPQYTGAPNKPLAALWGVSSGRAIVHELPIDPENPASMGWTFQPGQGVQIEARNFDATRQETVEERLWIALAGYTIRT